MLSTIILGCLMFTGTSFSDSGVKQILETKKEHKTSKKRTRRKKIQICHECGKPETKCECEGEEHGVKDDHEHEGSH